MDIDSGLGGRFAMAVIDAAPRLLTANDLLRLSSQGVRGELIRGCSARPCQQDESTDGLS